MIIRPNLLTTLLFICISSFSFSQTKQQKFNVNRDIDVARVYEQVVKEGYGTPFIYKELATAYYFKSEYKKALIWFEKLFEVETNIDSKTNYQYQQTLRALANNQPERKLNKV